MKKYKISKKQSRLAPIELLTKKYRILTTIIKIKSKNWLENKSNFSKIRNKKSSNKLNKIIYKNNTKLKRYQLQTIITI